MKNMSLVVNTLLDPVTPPGATGSFLEIRKRCDSIFFE
jgi:hypothetical protein